MARLNARNANGAKPRNADYFIWDDRLVGFGLRVRANGKKTFIVQYRTPEGRQRRRVIGPTPPFTADQARQDADEWLRNARRGKDPAEVRDRNRLARSLKQVCADYLTEHAKVHKKPSAAAEDERIVDSYLIPNLGKKKPVSVTAADVTATHKKMQGTPYMANRMLALLSKIFNHAQGEMRQLRADWINPCRGVQRYGERKRRRYLSGAELAALGEALGKAEAAGTASQADVAAVRLLIFTGCRRTEILSLKWEHVDFEGRRLRLPDSKTGAKDIYLSPPALQILEDLAARKAKADAARQVKRRAAGRKVAAGGDADDGSGFVFPGRNKGEYLRDLKHAWVGKKLRDGKWKSGLRQRAGLLDVRIHDLRHTFASVAAGGGLSLPVIGALLGHSQPATTARYAHLASDPLQEASDMIGARLEAALKGGRGGNVVEMSRSKRRKQSA